MRFTLVPVPMSQTQKLTTKLLIILILSFHLVGHTYDEPVDLHFTNPVALNSNATTDDGKNDTYLRVKTDGNGHWVAVWSVNGTRNSDVLVACSADNGQTWSAPALIKTNIATDNGSDYEPDLATDGTGHWVVVWTSYDTLNDTVGANPNILSASSADNGITWSAPVAVNADPARYTGLHFAPRVSYDGAGNFVTLWNVEDNRPGGYWRCSVRVACSSNNGADWTNHTDLYSINKDPYVLMKGMVASDGAGRTIACWPAPSVSSSDYDMYYAITDDGGTGWTVAAHLNTNWAGDNYDVDPSLAADGAGNWVAVWVSGTNLADNGTEQDLLVARSSDNGQTWSTPDLLNSRAISDFGADFFPRIVTDRAGTWLVCWSLMDMVGGTLGDPRDVLYSVSTDDGASWSAQTAVYEASYRDNPVTWASLAPAVDTDGAGRWIVAWESKNSLGGTLGTDADILFTTGTTPPVAPVKVLAPDGGETFASGGLMDIRWRTNVKVAGSAVRLEIWNAHGWVADLGRDWQPAGNQRRTILLPLIPAGSDYRLRATSTWDPELWDESNQPFTITGSPVLLHMPNGGELWSAGSQVPVWWEANIDFAGTAVRLELWRNAAKVADLGLDWAPEGDHLKWISVPNVAPGLGYTVRAVSIWDANYWDASDGSLTIQNDGWKTATSKAWLSLD